MAYKFPEWAIILYRGVRAAVAAGIAQAFILQPDWSNQDEAIRVVCVAFLSGFVVALGKWLRDILDKQFGFDEKSKIQQLMPI
jgi:hypothetical protein